MYYLQTPFFVHLQSEVLRTVHDIQLRFRTVVVKTNRFSIPLRLTPNQHYSSICSAPVLSCFRIHSEALLPVHRETTVTIQSCNASPGYLRIRVTSHDWGTADLLLTTVLYRVSGSSLRVPNFFVLGITS